jgi:methylmalonyl-CoA/ethylmalonyl-CoA epimerase
MTTEAASLGISGIGQIAVNVHDLDRATAFYRDVLSLPLLFTTNGMSFFHCGAVRLMLSRPEKPEFDHPSSILYFTVPDMESAYQQLVENKVQIERKPELVARMPTHDLWICFFHDSEQNLLALMNEAPRSA